MQFSSYVDLSSDGLHLNVNGYKKIAKIWFDSTINILKELAGTPNTQPTPTPGSGVKKGDINGDGEVNSIDYALLKRYLVGMDSTLPTPNGYAAADINGDGDINSIDYANLKLILLGMSN
ncbi:MAG TPA: dockerin type I domain-containing protein [Acetivibrio clariflavus]|nr:dockerin type I domain-containing protein [Acetivibrio clariflavus]